MKCLKSSYRTCIPQCPIVSYRSFTLEGVQQDRMWKRYGGKFDPMIQESSLEIQFRSMHRHPPFDGIHVQCGVVLIGHRCRSRALKSPFKESFGE
ncbi:hypothetical protein TNCV_62091 [Trichonephila clavipes]|nr:hypothetical protein TNCV_62091 [Trichonephila clavipes]